MSVPVYLVTGYLESGKTTLIRNTLNDPMFNSGEKTCLIVCEQGEEEYDEAFLKQVNAVVEYVDDESDLTTDFFASLDEKYRMDRVFIEYNGTMKLSSVVDVVLPFDWQLVQIITTIDASTYELMLKNMRSIFYDQMQMSDLVIFNRCESSINKSYFQTTIQSMSRGAMIVYEYLDGTVDQEIISVEFKEVDGRMMIDHQDYGFFYLQAMEKPQQYDGKRISIKGCVLKREEDGRKVLVLYRKAMVCCEDDIQIFGLKIISEDAMKYHDNDWIQVDGLIEVMFDDEFEGEVCIIHAEKITKIEPFDELVTFN